MCYYNTELFELNYIIFNQITTQVTEQHTIVESVFLNKTVERIIQ